MTNSNVAFELMVEQDVELVLDQEVKDEFYWREWFQGTLFINGMSIEAMYRVRDKLRSIYGDVRMSRCGRTDEYAFDFC
jgi:hypothetical protein